VVGWESYGVVKCVCGCAGGVSERKNEFVNEWLGGRVSEWVSVCVCWGGGRG